jgi:hypothetical protein
MRPSIPGRVLGDTCVAFRPGRGRWHGGRRGVIAARASKVSPAWSSDSFTVASAVRYGGLSGFGEASLLKLRRAAAFLAAAAAAVVFDRASDWMRQPKDDNENGGEWSGFTVCVCDAGAGTK